MTIQKRNFIIIDDNKLDCFIGQKIILNTGISDKISLFLDAAEALRFIQNNQMESDTGGNDKIIIIVDIQMPLMNGFEFVEAFENLPAEIQDKYVIFMLSSTINETDLARVGTYKSVKQIIGKPLSLKKLSALIPCMVP